MRLEEARFTGLPFTTRLSEKKKARDGRAIASQRRRRLRVGGLSSPVPLGHQPHRRKKRFESDGDCPMSRAFFSQKYSFKRFESRSSSTRTATAGVAESIANGFGCGDDHRDQFAGDLDKSGTLGFQHFSEESLGNDVVANTIEFHAWIDFGLDNNRPKNDELDINDREFTAELVRGTAFSVKSDDYRHAARVTWIDEIENPQYREASTEKREEKTEDAIGLSDSRKEICQSIENIEIEDELGTRTSLEECAREACDVVYSSSDGRYSPCYMLDNTAFNDDDDDDDDDEDQDQNGDNDDDYIICNEDDDEDNCKDCIDNRYGDARYKMARAEDDEIPERSMLTGAWSFHTREMSPKNAEKEESFCSDDDRRLSETSACVEVPGGKLFTVLRAGRSYTSSGRTTSTGGENNVVFFTKNRETDLVDGTSRVSNGRTPGRPRHDREKWKKVRRRRRRKYAENSNKYLDGCSGCHGDDDDDLLEKKNEDGYYRGIGEGNDYTARSREPITRLEGKRSERGKWCDPFGENLAKTKEEVLAKRRVERRASRGVGGKDKENGSERRRGTNGYGLLFALYLLALPILCSTDPSGPVALAFAQKSPLTHGDNFTVRNSSLKRQGHQMRRDGVLGDDSSHPYNEYTWEVNQINPWLSACDLAGPAPADLQGSCGPPEVPKNCPLPCASVSQGDTNKPFLAVIERLGVHNRVKSGAGGSAWRPADKRKNGKDEDGNTRTEEAVVAPEQCLFYLEESHKRDICRDNFGRGSSLSFSNSRENRYWFVSGLRLRHCCEHAVVNALAPGKGGPLEDVLNGGRKCAEALDKLLLVDALAARLHCEFEEVLARYDCAQPYSVIHNCTHCKEAYRKWVCSSLVPYFAHGGPPILETSAHAWSGLRLRPCRSFCQSVEQRCPYLLPGDRAPAYPTQYAGEPTFLCRDPNIPETGEQALRALHGNEEEECCFHVCSEEEPGSGVCTNCIGSEAHSRRAGHDTPTAPHCEITTSSIQSGSTDHQNNAEVSGSSRGSSNAETASSNPSPFTATSASFCGGGGVGSVSSSSGQSTTQTPPPSSISLIYLFWVWAALISLCTGQTVFPWAPPSSLLMLDHSSTGIVTSSWRFADYPTIDKKKRKKKKFNSSSIGKLAVASWWSCSSKSLSSSSSLSRPRFHESVFKLARVFLVSLSKTIHVYLRRFVNFFVVLPDLSLRHSVKCHWGHGWWRLPWHDSIYSRWIRRKLNTVGGWYSSSRSGERDWTEGPDCCINGKWCCRGQNEPRPPRGRRRRCRRRRRRRRPRRRRRRRRVHIVELAPRTLLRPLGNSTTATDSPRIPGQPLLAADCCYYYRNAGVVWRCYRYRYRYRFYRSQRHSYSHCKWKGPS